VLPELEPDTLLGAYASAMFPMADDEGGIMWFSPDPRAVLPLCGFHVSKNLRRRCRSARFEVTIDRDFPAVMAACADRQDGVWISHDIIEAYTRLHELGFAHSVETRLNGELVGGLYGVSFGGAFFGESMFFRETDASKVALVYLVQRMTEREFSLLDVQFTTAHLRQFGVVEIPRCDYLRELKIALSRQCVFAD